MEIKYMTQVIRSVITEAMTMAKDQNYPLVVCHKKKLRITDVAVAGIRQDNGNYVFIVTKKAGPFKIWDSYTYEVN